MKIRVKDNENVISTLDTIYSDYSLLLDTIC